MVRRAPLAAALALVAVAGCGNGDPAPRRPATVTATTPSTTSGTAATSTAAVPVPTASATVQVGPGENESSLRQVVRTADDRVWIVAPDDFGGSEATPKFGDGARMRLYRARTTGVPTAFDEVDAAHAVVVPSGQTISGADARLDRSGVLHVTYYRSDTDQCVEQTADLAHGRWGQAEVVAGGGEDPSAPNPYYARRGAQICGLTLLADDTPLVLVASTGAGVTAHRRTAHGWVTEATVSAAPSVHPAITTDSQGRVQAAWLQDDTTIAWAQRSAAGQWGQVQVVATGEPLVQGNAGLDQSPSLAVDGSDEAVVLWQEGHPGQSDSDTVVARHQADGSWPVIGPGVFSHSSAIHARGDDLIIALGHDADIHPGWLSRPAGATAWGPTRTFEPTGSYDGSASTRFDPLRDPRPDLVDVVTMDEDSPVRGGGYRSELYYESIQLPPAAATTSTHADRLSVVATPAGVAYGSRASVQGQLASGRGGVLVRLRQQVGGRERTLATARTGSSGRVHLDPPLKGPARFTLEGAGVASVAVSVPVRWAVSAYARGSAATVIVHGAAPQTAGTVQRLVDGQWVSVRRLALHPGRAAHFRRPSGSWRVVAAAAAGMSATTVPARSLGSSR